MTNEELLRELESAVEAMEQSLAIIAGTLAEAAGPAPTLLQMLAAKDAVQQHYGPNAWRDRLATYALRSVALKARRHAQDDPELQALIARVLGGRRDDDPTH